MAGEILSPGDRAHFLAMMRRQTNSAVHRRMNVLLLLDDGWSVGRICEALFIDEGTVREHRALYGTQGRAGVERLAYQGGSGPLRRHQIAALEAFVDRRRRARCAPSWRAGSASITARMPCRSS